MVTWSDESHTNTALAYLPENNLHLLLHLTVYSLFYPVLLLSTHPPLLNFDRNQKVIHSQGGFLSHKHKHVNMWAITPHHTTLTIITSRRSNFRRSCWVSRSGRTTVGPWVRLPSNTTTATTGWRARSRRWGGRGAGRPDRATTGTAGPTPTVSRGAATTLLPPPPGPPPTPWDTQALTDESEVTWARDQDKDTMGSLLLTTTSCQARGKCTPVRASGCMWIITSDLICRVRTSQQADR